MKPSLPSLQEAISSVEYLHYYAKSIAHGALTGIHRSGWHGASIEFAEHKPYSVGDDLKFIDWKVLAKTDKNYIKRYEDETDVAVYILLDQSSSMNYGTVGFTKWDFAKTLAACLSYLTVSQGDRLGVLTFGGEPYSLTPGRFRLGHFHYLLEYLYGAKPAGEKKLSDTIENLLSKAKKRSLIWVISDFIDFEQPVESVARWFRIGSHEVKWVHVQDPAEEEFPYREWTEFKGLENDGRIEINALDAAKPYRKEYARWVGNLRDISLENKIRYFRIRTDESIQQKLGLILQ